MRFAAATQADSPNGIEAINLGISMPFTTRIGAELAFYRDKCHLEKTSGFFTNAVIEVLLIANCVASVVEGVARAFFAVVLLLIIFLGNVGSRFYQKTLVGLTVNLLTIPAAMSMVFNHLNSESLCIATAQCLGDRLIGPWTDLVDPNIRTGGNEAISAMNTPARGDIDVAMRIGMLERAIGLIRGERTIPPDVFS